MADGSVTIKVDMDGSNAQSGVSKLKALFGGLENAGSKVGSVFKSVLGANLISSALTSGISTITGGIRGMASELNSSHKAWKTFEGNMQAFGHSAEEIKVAKAEMQDFATKTIYSASDMASTYAQLDAVGTKNVGSLVKAFGGLAASAENPAQAMKSLSTQATQMASKPKVAWMDFKIMMDQAPAGMAAVAKEMGMSTAELVSAVQDGKVKTEDFFDAINRAGNSDAFQKMATEFKTVGDAIDGAKESLSIKLMPVFEKLNKFGIKAVNAISDALDKINFGKLAEGLGKFFDGINIEAIISNISNTISNVVSKIKTFWSAFANTGAVSAFAGAIKSIAGALGHVWESLTASSVLTTLGNALGTVVKWLSQAAKMAANFVKSLPTGVIQAIAGGLVGLIAGFKAFNFLKSFNPFGIFQKNATTGISRVQSVVRSASNGIISVIRSLGQSVAAAARGIGQGIGAAFRGIGQGLSMVNPATILALSVAILAVGAAMALAGMQGAGIAKILQGIGSVIESVGQAFATIASSIIDAFAKALVTIAPSVQAFVPVIHAVGDAIGTVVVAVGSVAPQLAILVNAFGTAFSQIITAVGTAVQQIASGISQIVTAFAPIVETIGNTIIQVTQIIMTNLPPVLEAVAPIVETLGNVFTTTAQIIADAIVQIVQALAPVMPAVAEVASAISSAVSSIAEAFSSVVSQIAPIINSLANLFTSVGTAIQSALTPLAPIIEAFGNSIKSVFEGASDVIRSFGEAVKSILDGVSGVIKSIGEAIKNAGQGFKLFGEGVKLAGDNGLSAAAGIAAVAAAVTGLGVASAAGNLNGFREDLDKLDTVMYKISSRNVGTIFTQMGSGMQTAASMVTRLTTGLPLVATAMQQLGPASTSSASGIRTFAQVFSSLGSSLSTAVPMFTQMTSRFVQFNSGVAIATSGMTKLSAVISTSMMQAVVLVTSSMQQIVSVIRQSAINMTQAGQQAGRGVSNGVINGIRSGIGYATAAMSTMVSAIRSTALAGAGMMVGIGAMIGQGLAQGMYSALGAVTAAANALVAQAERAAQAKAKIHSPSRLFRDNVGRYIAQGIAVGIEQNASDVTDSLAYVQREMSAFKFGVEDLLGLGSSTLSSQFKLKSRTERAEKSQIEVIREQSDKALTRALEVAEEAVKRPVNLMLDDGALVAKIGQPMTNFQNDKLMLDNMMRGII